MNTLHTQEAYIPFDENGRHIYLKQWTPPQLSSSVPIILLHDSLGSVALWRDFPEHLAMQMRRVVIAYDRLGFGQSSAHPSTLDHQFVATEAKTGFAQVLQHCQIDDFIVMRHSIGGGMAMCCAAQYPSRCQAVITIAAQSIVEDQTLAGISEAKQLFQHPQHFQRLQKYHGEKAQWVLDAWTETWLSTAFRNWNLQAYTTQVKSPLLVIHGEFDEYGSLLQPQTLIQTTGGPSQLEIIANTQHMPHKEQPALVLKHIQQFLQAQPIS